MCDPQFSKVLFATSPESSHTNSYENCLQIKLLWLFCMTQIADVSQVAGSTRCHTHTLTWSYWRDLQQPLNLEVELR